MEPPVEWIEETSLLAALVLRGFMELASTRIRGTSKMDSECWSGSFVHLSREVFA